MQENIKKLIKRDWESTLIWDEDIEAFTNDYGEEFKDFADFRRYWIDANYGNSDRGKWLQSTLSDWEVQ